MLCWIPAALLWLGGLHLHKSRALPPAAAHLCVLLGSLLALSCAAMLNILPLAAGALFLGLAAVTLRDLRREGRANWLAGLRAYLTAPVLLAMAAGALLTVVYAVQKPVFTYWDEFLTWGVNAKILHLSGRLQTVGPPVAANNDPCGTGVLSYLFQYFSPQFSEAGLYLSYALLTFAVFATAAECVRRRAGTQAGALCFLALALSPFLQNYHLASQTYSAISYGYATAMADHLLAVGMLAVAALYLAAPDRHWYYAPLLFTGLIKESGLLFMAVMAGVVSLWRLLRCGPSRRVLPRWAAGMAMRLLGACASYLVWLVYVAVTRAHRSTSPLPGIAAAALLAAAGLAWYAVGRERRARCAAAARAVWRRVSRAALPAGLCAAAAAAALLWYRGALRMVAARLGDVGAILAGAFVPGMRSDYLRQTLDIVWQSFLTEKTLLPLPDWLWVALMLLSVPLLWRWCAGGGQRAQLAGTQAMMGLGALAYLYVMSYFVADYLESMGMVEYGRYFSSYLMGWVYLTLLLALAVPPRPLLQRVAALAAALLVTAATAQLGLDHTIVAAPENYQALVRQQRQQMQQTARLLEPGDHVLLVFKTLDTETCLHAAYDLYPALVGQAKQDTDRNYSIIFCIERDRKDHYAVRYNLATPEEFTVMLRRNFDYVYVAGDDGTYQRDYGALFEGGVQPQQLYRVTPQSDSLPLRRVEG